MTASRAFAPWVFAAMGALAVLGVGALVVWQVLSPAVVTVHVPDGGTR